MVKCFIDCIMKTGYLFLTVCVCLFLCCTREINLSDNGVKTYDCFNVGCDSPIITKAHIENGSKVKWDIGDEIGIFSDLQGPVRYQRGSDGKYRGDQISGNVFFAYYPFWNGRYDESSPNSISFQLGSEMPMVAKSVNNSLAFKQTIGVIHIRVRWSSSIMAAFLYNPNLTPMSGLGHISLDSDSPVFTLDSNNGSTNSTVNASIRPVEIDSEGKNVYDLYFPIPEMVLDNGFTLSITSYNKDSYGNYINYSKSTRKQCVIRHGAIKSFKLIDIDGELEEIEYQKQLEREALIQLFNALDGDHWTNNTNWCSDEPLNTWYGVDSYDGFVNQIRLSNNNLSGFLPDVFGTLTHLSSIALDNNSIEGTLPPSLGSLSGLWELSLSNNRLSGPLPDISEMNNLDYLNLSGNYLNGEIPACYSGFLDKHNWNLLLSDNCLTGLLPEEILNHPKFPNNLRYFIAQQKEGYGIRVDQLPAAKGTYKTLDGSELNLEEVYSESDYTLIVASSMTSTYKDTGSLLDIAKDYTQQGLRVIISVGDVKVGEDYQDYINLQQLQDFPDRIVSWYHPDDYDNTVFPVSPTFYTSAVVVDRNGFVVFMVDNSSLYSALPFLSTHMRNLDWFLATRFDASIYESNDYTHDGDVHVLQTATEGDGINIVIMGDAFSDRLIQEGAYQSLVEKSIDAFFSEEPFSSSRSLFNVYSIDVVSKNEVYYGETALGTYYSDGIPGIVGDSGMALSYANRALSDEQLKNAVVIVLANRIGYASGATGVCHLRYNTPDYTFEDSYGPGVGIAFCNVDAKADEQPLLSYLIHHEAGGHGFAKLQDEYWSINYKIDDKNRQDYEEMFLYGYWKNVDFIDNADDVKWSQFIRDSRYAHENIGCYEGGAHYAYGVWRPTETSIMRGSLDVGFNAPSRYAIWYRINKLAYGPEWQGTYEDFVEFDKPNRTAEAIAKRKVTRRNFVEKDFVPLAPPVIIEGDWRNLAKH